MGFKKSKNRKTYSTESTSIETQQIPNIVPLNVQLDLENYAYQSNDCDYEHDFHFVRFFYKGFPYVSPAKVINGSIGSAKLFDENAVDMRLTHESRTELIKGIYDYSKVLERQNKSALTIISALTQIGLFIKACDEEGVEATPSIDCAQIYSKHLNKLWKIGEIQENTARMNQGKVLNWLQWSGIEAKEYVHHFSHGRGGDDSGHSAYTRHEIKQLSKVMHSLFAAYGAHAAKGTTPETCLFSPKDTPEQQKTARRTVYANTNANAWLTTLSASALYLMSLYTGINMTPLMKLCRSDINYNRKFITKAEQHSLQLTDEAIERVFGNDRDFQSNAYDLTTEKGRAKFNRQQTPLGFSKYGREFLETWLLLLDKLDAGDYLFPNFSPNRKGDVISKNHLTNFCNLIENHTEAPRPVNSRFRATKSDVLVTITNDYIVAAHANNHSPETAKKNYSKGNTENKERSLAKSISAWGALVDGMEKREAIAQAEAKFTDPISPEEFEKLRAKQNANSRVVCDTTVGKCTDALGDKAKRQARELLKNGLIKEGDEIPPCMKFFECLTCKSYAITTDFDDIWLLLSFQFLLFQKLSRPAINSMPSSKYKKLQERLMQLAESLRQKQRQHFDTAQHRISERKLHPVWQEEADLNDILGE